MPGTFCDTEELIELSKIAAERFHIADRGYLKEDCKADLVVFDFADIKDNAALFDENPGYSSGVEHVLINGELVPEGARHNDVLPGRVIRNAG